MKSIFFLFVFGIIMDPLFKFLLTIRFLLGLVFGNVTTSVSYFAVKHMHIFCNSILFP